MDNQNQNDPIKDPKAVVHFLTGLAEKHSAFARHIDNQANILIGLSTGIFVLVANQVLNSKTMPLYFFTAMIFSALSAIMGLLTVHPPKFMRKKGQKESVMLYNKAISSFKSPEEYAEKLKNLFNNQNELFHEFGLEIFNLSKYYYRPKRTLFVYSRNLLIAGIIISVSLLLFS